MNKRRVTPTQAGFAAGMVYTGARSSVRTHKYVARGSDRIRRSTSVHVPIKTGIGVGVTVGAGTYAYQHGYHKRFSHYVKDHWTRSHTKSS